MKPCPWVAVRTNDTSCITGAARLRFLRVSLEFIFKADKTAPVLIDYCVKFFVLFFEFLNSAGELSQPLFSGGDDLGYCYQQKDEENPTQNAGKS